VSGWFTFALWLVGVGLLSIELFVPSLVAGGCGVLALGASVVLTWMDHGPVAGGGLAVGSLVAAVLILRVGGSRLALKETLSAKEGFVSADDHSGLIGQRGVAATMLRPGGFATIGGKRIGVVTIGELIEQGVGVEVTAVEGNRIVVRRVP